MKVKGSHGRTVKDRENSRGGRTANSRSLRCVVEFLQDGSLCLHGIAFLASGRLYAATFLKSFDLDVSRSRHLTR